jgi:type II secretory pathway pseudopilin PulG
MSKREATWQERRNASCAGNAPMQPHERAESGEQSVESRARGSRSRAAMTLVELLVVIVILVTLVAGVIPILSPDNEVRKIRQAATGLQTFINATISEAARIGRPQGIGLLESSAGSGMALEAFRLEVPPGFAGFSDQSRVQEPLATGMPYGSFYGTINRYTGYPTYRLNFVLVDAVTLDPLPPGMFRPFDIVEISGNQFMIVDSDYNVNPSNNKWYRYDTDGDANGQVWFFGDPSGDPAKQVSNLECIWLNNHDQQLPPGLRPYQIFRQPIRSSALPYVLPAGVGVDLQGSVQGGGITNGFPVPRSFDTFDLTDPSSPQPILDSLGIMFSPLGHIDALRHNGSEIANVARIALLIGRVGNGGLQFQANGSGAVTGGDWVMNTGDTDEQLAEKQLAINWLNRDSRLLILAASSGRSVVSELAFVDARRFGTELPAVQAIEQIEASHEFAHGMK